MVDEVIARMGKPEDFMEPGEEETEADKPEDGSNKDQRLRRRLYRDADSRVLGGVCSGMGAYFNIDVVIFRILFVLSVFMGGAGVLIYIILWIGSDLISGKPFCSRKFMNNSSYQKFSTKLFSDAF